MKLNIHLCLVSMPKACRTSTPRKIEDFIKGSPLGTPIISRSMMLELARIASVIRRKDRVFVQRW
jgi:hypothetical protein